MTLGVHPVGMDGSASPCYQRASTCLSCEATEAALPKGMLFENLAHVFTALNNF